MASLEPHTLSLVGKQMIEASAGTGKTYTITSLYLRLLLGRDSSLPPLQVEQILVLTFTIAATDELKTRVRLRVNTAYRAFCGESVEDEFILRLVASSTDTDADRRRLLLAVTALDEAAIYTIHSFCARVLGDESFNAGVLFEQDLSGDKDVFLQLAVEDCYRTHVLGQTGIARSTALKLWASPDKLLKQIRGYIGRRTLEIIPAYEPALENQLLAFNTELQALKTAWQAEQISQLLADSGISRASKTFRRLPEMDLYVKSEDTDLELWTYYTPLVLEQKTNKGKTVPSHSIFNQIENLTVLGQALNQLQTNLFHEVINITRRNLALHRVRTGQLTLDDLLTGVFDAVSANPELAASLRRRWPVAMIDEFQDTDDIQYGIFEGIYSNPVECGLLLIGDPKQAIYQFRGADIYTYINARHQVSGNTHVLDTNYRSTPPLVAAVNFLFDQSNMFGNDQDIPFEPVKAAAQNEKKSLDISGKPAKPFTVCWQSSATKPISLHNAVEFAAEETAILLNGARRGEVVIDAEPLQAGQIAFLVRQGSHAEAARQALARRGIRSVYVTLQSVLLTDTAEDLAVILEAVIDPGNETLLRTALATGLMQTTAEEIDALNSSWQALHDVMTEFHEYHQLWATREIAPMLESLLARRGIAKKWFRQTDGERQITNFRHLTELLQTQSLETPGMHQLLKWFAREKIAADSVAVEARQLRLESDQHLVKIVTMHAAKGLEYDVVMIPMATFGEQAPGKGPALFHQNEGDDSTNYNEVLDVAGEATNLEHMKREQLFENLRLLYVAITRARYKCYLGVATYRGFSKTAIAKLLQLPDKDEDVERQLASLPGNLFEIRQMSYPGFTTCPPSFESDELVAPPVLRRVSTDWRMHSYTGLTRRLEQVELDQPAGAEAAREQSGERYVEFHDDDDAVPEPATEDEVPSRFTFPRGPRIGVAMHSLFEHLDFKGESLAIAEPCQLALGRMGLLQQSETWLPILSAWTEDVLATPLSPAGFKLSDISRQDRLDEMEFHFPVHTSAELISRLQAAGYLTPETRLSPGTISGMLTGFIDLIVRHQGKYYLIDYKSNHLGNTQNDYAPADLKLAVRHHYYDLQYLLYSVALTRFLRQRLADFNFSRDFGGVAYLFLRGMNCEPDSGVFFDQPGEQLVTELDMLLTGLAE